MSTAATAHADAPALSTRQRRWTLAVWALLVAAAVWHLTQAVFVADLSAFLPAKPDARQQILIEQLQSGVAARTLLVGIDGGTSETRAAASKALAARLRGNPRFDQVHNGETDAYRDIGTFLFEHRYQLSPAITPERFTADGLKAGINETLSLLGTPLGGALKPLLDRDPTGETQRIAEALIPGSAPKSEHGVWVSRQKERALLVLGSHAAGADLDGQATAVSEVRAAFAAVQADPALKDLVLQLSGAPVFSVDSRAQIEREIRWLSISGTVAISALLLLAFGSAWALAAGLMPVLSGVLVGIVAVSLLFGSVHGITLGFGTTLLGEAVDYAIYFLIQARSGGWRAWLRNSWPTVRLGLLTSLCGFAALVFSGFPGLMQLGVFSIAGLLGAAATTRWVMPVLRPHGAPGTRMRLALGRGMARLVQALPRTRPLWTVAAVLALGAVAWQAQQGQLWRAELSSLSPVRADALALDAELRADLSAGDARSLVAVEAPDLQSLLQRCEAVVQRLEPLVDQGAIGGVDSLTRWLPSDAVQAARRAALPEREALRAALAQATAGGPLKADRLVPFLDAVDQAREQPPLTLAQLRATSLKPLLEAMLLERPAREGRPAAVVALLPLQPAGDRFDGAAVQQALAGLPDVQVLTIGEELSRLYARYLAEAQVQALLGALGVVVLMALVLRNGRRLAAVCWPLALAVLLVMGGFALSGAHLGILHLVGLLLVVAVGSNYALFFVQAAHDASGQLTLDEDTFASLALANLTTVLSFSLIALSQIPALAAIGCVVGPGALLGLVLAAAFAPRPRTSTDDAKPQAAVGAASR